MEENDELITTVAEQQMQIADLTLKLEFVDAERTDLLRRTRVALCLFLNLLSAS